MDYFLEKDGQMKYKAIFTDIDGTLVSFKTHRVPESTLAALTQAHEDGVKIIIATGRPYGDFDVINGVPCDAVIALNGADCRWNDGSVICRHFIEYKDFKSMQALSDSFGFALCLETSEGFFVNRITKAVVELAEKIDHKLPEVCDIDEKFRMYGCGQLAAYFPEEQQNEIMSHVPALYASRWHPAFADIDLKGVSKGGALREMAGLMGISIEETIAFGDGGNDIPLIEAAGLGVAMGNSGDDVKAAAGYVTGHVDEDGFADALRRFVLKK